MSTDEVTYADAGATSPGYAVEVDDEAGLRRRAGLTRLRKHIVSWILIIIPALTIGFHDDVFSFIHTWPTGGIVPGDQLYILYLLLIAVVWLAAPLLYFEYLWYNRLDLGTRSNDTYSRTNALQKVVDIYAESQKYSMRALLFGIVAVLLTYETIRAEPALSWSWAGMVLLTIALLALAAVYQMRRIGPYLIDNILFVCIRSEQSTMSHQEAVDQLRTQGSPRFRTARPDLYY